MRNRSEDSAGLVCWRLLTTSTATRFEPSTPYVLPLPFTCSTLFRRRPSEALRPQDRAGPDRTAAQASERGLRAMVRKRKVRITVSRSSGNVFADLGLPEPEEELTKAQLASQIRQ